MLKDVQDSFDIIFLDVPKTLSQIPENTNAELDSGMQMLDNTISFLNEYQIEEERVYKTIEEMKVIVKGMIFSLSEIMSFFDIIEKYNEIVEKTQSSTNTTIIGALEKFQTIAETFNEAVEIMEKQFESLLKVMKNQKNQVTRIQNAIPQEAVSRDPENFYSKKRIEAMDLAVKELPDILNAKVDIDGSLQKVNIQIGKINTLRR